LAVASADAPFKRERSSLMIIRSVVLLSVLSLAGFACGGNKPETETPELPATEPATPPAETPPMETDSSEPPAEASAEEPSESP
jgi:hypothetical protein